MNEHFYDTDTHEFSMSNSLSLQYPYRDLYTFDSLVPAEVSVIFFKWSSKALEVNEKKNINTTLPQDILLTSRSEEDEYFIV